MGILEYGAKFCAKKLDEMDRTQRYPIAVPSPEIVLHTDLPYCSGGDPAHRLDLCYPAKGGDFPLVIDIHGGGLIYGTKALNRDFTLHLAEQGFAVASLDYRLVPQTRFDGQIRDLFAGFRWLSEHLNDHPIQKDAVFFDGGFCRRASGSLCRADRAKLPAATSVSGGAVWPSAAWPWPEFWHVFYPA